MGDRKVAVFVDDDSDFLELIPEIIQHPRYEIRTYRALNGYRIIDEIIKIKPDVLFIDFFLPRANAGQILPILRSIQTLARIPVYFVTGRPKEEIMPFLEDLDYDGIIFKSDAFKDAVLHVLDRLDHTVSI